MFRGKGRYDAAMATGREAWLLAGQTLLRRGGVHAVKLQALCEELGLTTGSFYHHFGGMPSYLDALAGYYGTEQTLDNTRQADDPDPHARIRKLLAIAHDDRMRPLDAAMRDWAGTNPIAAAAVEEADTVLLRFLERAFLDLGCDRSDARVRSLLLLSAGVARLTPPWRVTRAMATAAIDLLAP